MGKSLFRSIAATVLAVLVAILAIPAVALFWVHHDVLDPDRYLATVEPLASDPQVQAQATDRITDAVMAKLDIPAWVGEIAAELPPQAGAGVQAMAGPLTSATEKYLHDAVAAVVASDAFAAAWAVANKAGHAALLALLRGDGTLLQVDGDTVTLDLGPVVAKVKAKLVDDGFALAARIPDVHTQLELFSSPAIGKAEGTYDALQVLRWALPAACVVLLALALLVAPNRWRTLLVAAVGVAVAMVLLGASTWVGRKVAAPDTGGTVYDTLAGPLRADIRWVLLGAVLVAVAAWLVPRLLRRRQQPA